MIFRFAYNIAIIRLSTRSSFLFANSGCELEPAYSVRRRYDSAIVVEPQDVREWSDVEALQSLHNWVVENLEQAYQKQAYYNLQRCDRSFRGWRVGAVATTQIVGDSKCCREIITEFSGIFQSKFCRFVTGHIWAR